MISLLSREKIISISEDCRKAQNMDGVFLFSKRPSMKGNSKTIINLELVIKETIMLYTMEILRTLCLKAVEFYKIQTEANTQETLNKVLCQAKEYGLMRMAINILDNGKMGWLKEKDS